MALEDTSDLLWEVGLCEWCSGGCCVCCSTMLGCGSCAVASAMATMDGSSCCFNLACMNCAFARIYARQAYGIPGSPGWDVCLACCPCTCCCSACQVANHIRLRGAPDTLPPLNYGFVTGSNGCPADRATNICMDPCGLCLTGLTAPCTSAAQGAQVTGLPFWAHFFCSSFYVDHHILRKNFGVPGSDLCKDCVEPCCCRVGVNVCLPGLGCCVACLYTIQHLENDRLLLAQAVATGAPRMMLNSEVHIELPAVHTNRAGAGGFSLHGGGPVYENGAVEVQPKAQNPISGQQEDSRMRTSSRQEL